MNYEGTLTNCRQWTQNGQLAAWLHRYLLSEGDNAPLSEGLTEEQAVFHGPVTMPMHLFSRCSGPAAEGLTFRVDAGWWEYKVARIVEAVKKGADLPPLIIGWRVTEETPDGAFELNDGNHRWEAFRRLGVAEYPVILWCYEEQLPWLLARYGQHMA